MAHALVDGYTRIHQLQTGTDDHSDDPTSIYELLGVKSAPQREKFSYVEMLKNDSFIENDQLSRKTVTLRREKQPKEVQQSTEEGESPEDIRRKSYKKKFVTRFGGFSEMRRRFSSTLSRSEKYAERMLKFRSKMHNYLEGDIKNLNLEEKILRFTTESFKEK